MSTMAATLATPITGVQTERAERRAAGVRQAARRPRPAVLRGPQAHPDRHQSPGSAALSSAPISAVAVRSCAVVVPARPAAGWQITERGYAVMVGAVGVVAMFLMTMLVVSFLAISNAPLS